SGRGLDDEDLGPGQDDVDVGDAAADVDGGVRHVAAPGGVDDVALVGVDRERERAVIAGEGELAVDADLGVAQGHASGVDDAAGEGLEGGDADVHARVVAVVGADVPDAGGAGDA